MTPSFSIIVTILSEELAISVLGLVMQFDYSESGGSKLLRNVCNELPVNTSSYLLSVTQIWLDCVIPAFENVTTYVEVLFQPFVTPCSPRIQGDGG
jgi:hypothetical protein